jgi:hypothetical protein
MSKHAVAAPGARKRFSPLVLAAGLAAAVALSLSFSGTLSAWTASIIDGPTAAGNSVTTASVSMLETSSDNTNVSCSSTSGTNNSYSCTTVNLYGNSGAQPLSPNTSHVVHITLKNTGTVTPTAFSMTTGACSQTTVTGGATDLCDKVYVAVKQGASDLLPASTSLNSLHNNFGVESLTALAPGTTVDMTFTITLAAGADNTYQGLTASQPVTFSFTA